MNLPFPQILILVSSLEWTFQKKKVALSDCHYTLLYFFKYKSWNYKDRPLRLWNIKS